MMAAVEFEKALLNEVAAGEQSHRGRGELYGQRVAQVFWEGIRLHRDVMMRVCTREEYA